MKQLCFLLAALCSSIILFAQNVGIGTNTPNARLDVKSSTSNYIAQFNGISPMYVGLYEADVYRGYIGSFSGAAEDVDFGTAAANTTGKLHLATQATPRLTVNSAGNVGIGTTAPNARLHIAGNVVIGNSTSLPATGFTLSIAGKAICEELKIQLSTGWPDYVFADNYNLMPLDELEKSIQQHKHLPNIPSAATVEAEKGFQVGELNRKLLEKVEELTLYVIELNKKNLQLAAELQQLKQQVAQK
jgi:hypothetical protein